MKKQILNVGLTPDPNYIKVFTADGPLFLEAISIKLLVEQAYPSDELDEAQQLISWMGVIKYKDKDWNETQTEIRELILDKPSEILELGECKATYDLMDYFQAKICVDAHKVIAYVEIAEVG